MANSYTPNHEIKLQFPYEALYIYTVYTISFPLIQPDLSQVLEQATTHLLLVQLQERQGELKLY